MSKQSNQRYRKEMGISNSYSDSSYRKDSFNDEYEDDYLDDYEDDYLDEYDDYDN